MRRDFSGAIQHKAGMQDSECIIAVNKNDTAPIRQLDAALDILADAAAHGHDEVRADEVHGRDLAPRCAARLHTGLCADCTHLDIDVANYIQFLREASTLDVDSQKWDMEDRLMPRPTDTMKSAPMRSTSFFAALTTSVTSVFTSASLRVKAVLLGGEGIEAAAKELGGYGADKVYVCESPMLSVYSTSRVEASRRNWM